MLHGTLAVLVTFTLLSGSCDFTTQESDRQVQALRQLSKETAIYPAFEKGDCEEQSKSTGAVVSCYYKSSASFDDVKTFYTDEFRKKGWGVPEERRFHRIFGAESRQLIFYKGDYRINIDHETDRSYDWDYSVAFVWEKK